MRHPRHICIFLAFSLAGSTAGQTPPSKPAPDLSDAAAVAALERDLGSEDFQTRERGQALLDRLDPSSMETLRKLAKQTADPELQARFLARVEMLEEIKATDPPRISLNVDGVSLTRVAQDLSAALGVTIGTSGPNDPYTLKLSDATFPEVIQRLNQQHPIWLTGAVGGAAGLRMARLTGVWEQSMTFRGFGVFIRDSTLPVPPGAARGAVAAVGGVPAAAAGAGVGPGFIVGVVADPRIHLTQITAPEITAVTDDAKNRWLPLGVGRTVTSPLLPQPCVLTQTVQIISPDNPGKVITSLRGQFSAEVALEEERIVIDNVATRLNAPIRAGGQEITIQTLSLTDPPAARAGAGKVLRFQMSVKPADGGAAGGIMGTSAQGGTISVVDADNQELVSRGFPRGASMSTSMSASIPAAREPLKVIITAATRTKTITIPFEFKNLPVPQH